MSFNKVMLIDVSFFCYFYHYGEEIVVKGKPMQAFLKSIATIRYFLAQGFEVELLWDGHAQWRYDILPEYKSSRRKNEELAAARAFIKSEIHPLLKEFLTYLPVTQYYSPDDEADDLATYRIDLAARKEEPVMFRMLCSDTDWLQLVGPQADWWNFRTKKITSHIDFTGGSFYDTPSQVAEVKILTGDKSDDIPGVSGIADTRALYLLRKYGGLESLVNAVKNSEFEENKNFSAVLEPEFFSTVQRNTELIKLSVREMPSLEVTHGQFNEAGLLKILNKVDASSQIRLWNALDVRLNGELF